MTILPTSTPPTGTLPKSYQHFWAWFQKNEQSFLHALTDMQNTKRIEEKVLDKLSPKLDKLHKGLFPLAGKIDNATAELIFSVNGVVEDIALAEELVDAAPVLAGWKFTALKPAIPLKLHMEGCSFDADNMAFYVNQDVNYPDTITITVAHNDYDNHPESMMYTGVCSFLDNYLGELVSATTIDELIVIDIKAAHEPLTPINGLRDYLARRQNELDRKYLGVTYHAGNDMMGVLRGALANGQPLFAFMNMTLLKWDAKASHPWVLAVTAALNGKNLQQKHKLLDKLTEELTTNLPASAGCLNIGRQRTAVNQTVYFACQDFRIPSQVVRHLQRSYAGSLAITYELYKDKSWQTFEKFATSGNLSS